MTIETLLANTYFFDQVGNIPWTQANKDAVTAALTNLYNTPTAKIMLDKITTLHPLRIDYVPNLFKAHVGLKEDLGANGAYALGIDPSHLDKIYYISPTGEAFQATLEAALAHELVHAIDALYDNMVSPDFAGDTIKQANVIFSELGLPDRLTYKGAGNIPNVSDGDQLTGGQAIDNAVYSGSDYDVETKSHITNSRDLLIGDDTNNILKGYTGNDFIYGNAGNDTLVGGTGDDSLDGGEGADTYIFNLLDNEDTIMSSELGDKIEIDFGGPTTVTLKGEAIFSDNSAWDYMFDYGGTTSYFRWTGNIDVAGSTGDLTIDFDDTLFYDLVVKDFQNGDFGIDLGGTSGDGDRGQLLAFSSPTVIDDFSNWSPFNAGLSNRSPDYLRYDGDEGYEYITSGGLRLFNVSGNGMQIGGIPKDATSNQSSYGFGYLSDQILVDYGMDAYSAGDPHIVTYDDLLYDFQDAGEFTLVRSTNADDFIIQTRQEKWDVSGSNDMFSVNTAVATQLGTTKVGFYINGSLPYDPTAYGLDQNPLTSEIPVLYVGDEAFILRLCCKNFK